MAWTRIVKTIDDTVQMLFEPTADVQHSKHSSPIWSRQPQSSQGK